MEQARKLEPFTIATEESTKREGFLAKFGSIKIGVIPLPLYIIIALVVYAAAVYKQLPADMIGGFAVTMVLGIFLGDLGKKLPLLKNIGGPAILALLVPSVLVFFNLINTSGLNAVTQLMKTSNFLYLYISVLVVGSILGMNRKVLIQGFTRMFVPLIVGMISAVVIGSLVGLLFGYSIKHTIFYIVVPILGGGIGEGILPLSIGYGQVLGKASATFVGQMVPAVVISNTVAIICSGILSRIGERKPKLTGNGVLVKVKDGDGITEATTIDKPIDFPLMGAGLLLACSFFILGGLGNKFLGIPGPVLMIIAAAVIKSIKIMPVKMEQGAFQLYKFVSGNLTYPLMVGLGILYIPLKDVVKIVTPSYVIVCATVVLVMISSGFLVGKLMKMFPVDSAIVTSCSSGMGGTGDVAILSAAGRMSLMPFAQVCTRIGGASTVIVAIMLLKLLS